MYLVSIVIPTYNNAHYLQEAIDSVLRQTYQQIELIVVDDGSIDSTKTILARYGDTIIYVYQKNKGPSAARNKGISIAKGDYIGFLDADDVIMPQKIEMQIKLLWDKRDVGIAYCWRRFIDEKGNALPQIGKTTVRGKILDSLLENSLFPSSVLLFRRNVVSETGLFDEELFTGEDWDYCLRAATKGFTFDYVPEFLVNYRVHGSSECDNYGKMEKSDLRFIEKAYSTSAATEDLIEKKNRALFSIYNEHAWHYFVHNEFDKGISRLSKAIEAYPEGFADYQNYLYFAQCIMPRGYRINEEVYKKVNYIEDIFDNAFNRLRDDKHVPSSISLSKPVMSAKHMALGWMFYYARDMHKSRRNFIKAFSLRPSYLLRPINILTFLKSFISRDAIEAIKGNKITKKILYILDIFPAISETFILNEMLELERQGHEVSILARRKEESVPHGIVGKLKAKIVYLPDARRLDGTDLLFSHIATLIRHPVRYLKAFKYALHRRKDGHLWFFKVSVFYARIAGKIKFSHMHSHFASLASCYTMYISRLLGKPFTFTIHGWYDLYEAPPSDLAGRAASAKKVITISDYNKRYLISKFKIPAEKIEVIHCGVDLDYFNNRPQTEDHRPKTTDQRPETTRIILSVARLHAVKNLETLIRACSRLAKNGNGFKCAIVGEGGERPKLEKLICDMGLTATISLLGSKNLEEVRDLYKTASVYVLPSKHETMGVTTMEAMATGIPVISTNIYGIPELIDDGQNGYLIDPEDDARLAVHLEELLGDDFKRAAFGKNGRGKIDSDFNLNKEVNKLIKVWFDGKD